MKYVVIDKVIYRANLRDISALEDELREAFELDDEEMVRAWNRVLRDFVVNRGFSAVGTAKLVVRTKKEEKPKSL